MIEAFVIGSMVIMGVVSGILIHRARRQIAAWEAYGRRTQAEIDAMGEERDDVDR